MSSKRLLIVTLIVVGRFTAGALAQKNELELGVARTFVSDQARSGPISSTLMCTMGGRAPGTYGLLRPGFTRLTFEVPVMYAPDVDLNYAANEVPSSHKALFAAPSLRAYIFGENAFSPWFSIGGGVAHLRSVIAAGIWPPKRGQGKHDRGPAGRIGSGSPAEGEMEPSRGHARLLVENTEH